MRSNTSKWLPKRRNMLGSANLMRRGTTDQQQAVEIFRTSMAAVGQSQARLWLRLSGTWAQLARLKPWRHENTTLSVSYCHCAVTTTLRRQAEAQARIWDRWPEQTPARAGAFKKWKAGPKRLPAFVGLLARAFFPTCHVLTGTRKAEPHAKGPGQERGQQSTASGSDRQQPHHTAGPSPPLQSWRCSRRKQAGVTKRDASSFHRSPISDSRTTCGP